MDLLCADWQWTCTQVEDMTDEAFEARHQVCEEEEKQRFAGLLSKAVLTQAKPSGGSQAPQHRLPYDSMESSMSPPPAGLPCCAPCEVDPYEPRTFPLAQEEYEQMVADSPHLLPSPPGSPSHMDTSQPSLETGPLESDTLDSGPPDSGPPEPPPLAQPPLAQPPLAQSPLAQSPLAQSPLAQSPLEERPLELPPLEPPPLELLEPADEPDPGGLTFDPSSYLVPKEAVQPEPPDPPAECLSVVPLSNDDPGWTSETKENLIIKLTKR
uniref:Putative vegetative cell wall protein gp1 n=1 Tax=Rhipicephalus pulchellus TaxID=72859 RepID=L7LVB1_RHIPC